jgi:aryl-alcohol dehydrogenase-like predicted oxidoreductase
LCPHPNRSRKQIANAQGYFRRVATLGVNFLDTSASYGKGNNHRVIGEAIRGRRHDVVIHSKSGSPRDGSTDAVRGGGDPRYLRQTCEQSLRNLGIETLDVFYMSRVVKRVLPFLTSSAIPPDAFLDWHVRILGMAMMAYAVLGRGLLSAQVQTVEEMAADALRTLCSRQTISRKSTTSYRPAPRPALAIQQDKCTG